MSKITWGSSAGKGRGVFAAIDFVPGETVETAPVILIDAADVPNEGVRDRYLFDWGDGRCAIGLGYLSLYNHSDSPNVLWEQHSDALTISMIAVRRIERGEELLFDYKCPEITKAFTA